MADLDTAIMENWEPILKDFVLPTLTRQFGDWYPLLQMITVGSQHVVGKTVKGKVHTGRALSGGARFDKEELAGADYQKGAEFSVTIPGNYWSIEVTDMLIAATATSQGVPADAVDALRFEMTRAIDDMKTDLNRQLNGIGEGVIGKWKSGDDPTAGSGYTLESSYTGAGTGTFGDTFGAKYIEDTMHVNVVDRGTTATVYPTTATATGYTCSSVDKDNNTVVLSGDPGITEAVPDYLTKAGSYADGIGTSAYAKREMMGLAGIVHDDDVDTLLTAGTTSHPLQGLDVSTYPFWKAKVFAHSGGRGTGQRPLTEELLDHALGYLETIQRIPSRELTMWVTKNTWNQFIYDELAPDRRFVNTITLPAGVDAVAFKNVPVVFDPDMIEGWLYILHRPSLTVQQMGPINWINRNGSILTRKRGYAAYEATLAWYAELVTFRRNAHVLIADLEYTPY